MFHAVVFPLLLVYGWMQFAAADCPESWVVFKDSCYTIIDTKATWTEANEICKLSDSHLAEITSQDEFNFIDQFIKVNASGDMWIGLSDILTHGEWTWTVSLDKARYSAWVPGQPNEPDKAHCAAIRRNDAHWLDRECHGQNQFICEKSRKYLFLIG